MFEFDIDCQKLGALISVMETLISETAVDGKERLLKFCPSGTPTAPTITATPPVTGGETGVPFEQIDKLSCGPSDEIGTFHTHPSSDNTPSMADLVFSILDGHDVFCIGARSTPETFVGGFSEGSQSMPLAAETEVNKIACYRVRRENRDGLARLNGEARAILGLEQQIVSMMTDPVKLGSEEYRSLFNSFSERRNKLDTHNALSGPGDCSISSCGQTGFRRTEQWKFKP